MKFLCDVHISRKVVRAFEGLGFEALHVNDILKGTHTTDKEICEYADNGGWVVITKDSDFRDSYFIKGTQVKLIKVNLGNTSNASLIETFQENIHDIVKLSTKPSFMVEVDTGYINVIIKD